MATKKPVRKFLAIHVLLIPGVCRWCRCTDDYGCEVGCSWVDRAHTLCSNCADFDRQMRSAAGRAQIIEDVTTHRDLALS